MLIGKIQAVTGFIGVSLVTVGFLLADPTATNEREYETTNYPMKPTPTPAVKKTFTEYREISLGNTADAVRQKLGIPKDKSDAQDLYTFSDNESAQFYYSDAHLVTAIMITYMGNLKDAPTAKDVFGEDVPAKPDGSIFKMVRYPKAGYWISYNRSGGDDAIISIAIQKL